MKKSPSPKTTTAKKTTYAHDLLTREALDYIANAKPDQPFFLYLAYTIPHFDLDVPEDSMAPYAGKWEEPNLPMGAYLPQSKPRAAYAGMISRMDRDIGRLLALLKQRGLDDDTLVIFTSDNGPTLLKGLDVKFFNCAGPFRGLKEDLYEGGIRVPFIARWPGHINPNTTTDLPAAFYDILPSLADLTGAQAPAKTDGLTLLPTLLNHPNDQKPHDFFYWEFSSKTGSQAVRLGDFKGVRLDVKKNPNAPIALYDLKTDIAESTDIAEKRPDVVKRIAEIMKSQHVESKEFPLLKAEK